MSIYVDIGGNVGIGTTIPLTSLHVKDLRVGTSTQFASLQSRTSNVIVPSATGTINGVNITALNKRTRTSYAAAATCVNSWTTRSSASDALWQSICWAPELSLFCAVALIGIGNGLVMTSSDGIQWTTRTVDAINSLVSVCWAPELSLFCAVGPGNQVVTSTDGITWTTRAAAASLNWQSVCWAPELSLFCAIAVSGSGNRVMTSPNGITWTSRTSPADNSWQSVCWSPELCLFCAVASTGTGNRVMTSPNGINWTTRSSAVNNNWISVCWAPELSLFCAVATSMAYNQVMTSPDGINWTARTAATPTNWVSVCWAPELSIFCAVGEDATNRIMTSPDGITWTARTSGAQNAWQSVCWAPELSMLCAVAYSGTGDRVMTSAIGMPNAKSVVKALPSQMMVDANGNVGIGTSIPTGKLRVEGTLYQNDSIIFTLPSLIYNNMITNSLMMMPFSFTTATYTNVAENIPLNNISVGSRSFNFVVTRSVSDVLQYFYYYLRIQRGANSLIDWTWPLLLSIPAKVVDSLNWGTSTPTYSQLTLSFWARSTNTGLHWITVFNGYPTNTGVGYYTTFNITSNNWEFFTITVPSPGNVGKFASMTISYNQCGIASATSVGASGVLVKNTWTTVSVAKTGYPVSSDVSSLATYYGSSTNYIDIAAPLLVPGSIGAVYPNYYIQHIYAKNYLEGSFGAI